MSEDEAFREFVDRLYKKYRGTRVGEKYIYILNLAREFKKTAEQHGQSWKDLDLEAIIDPSLTYRENIRLIHKAFTPTRPSSATTTKIEHLSSKMREELRETAMKEVAKWICRMAEKPSPELIEEAREQLSLKPHPTCLMSKTIRLVREGVPLRDASRQASAICVVEGKINPSTKLRVFREEGCPSEGREEEWRMREWEMWELFPQ